MSLRHVGSIPCRFMEKGCQGAAAEIIYVPKGCLCWPDPVQALCEQHLLTMETTGSSETILDLRAPSYIIIDDVAEPMSKEKQEELLKWFMDQKLVKGDKL